MKLLTEEIFVLTRKIQMTRDTRMNCLQEDTLVFEKAWRDGSADKVSASQA